MNSPLQSTLLGVASLLSASVLAAPIELDDAGLLALQLLSAQQAARGRLPTYSEMNFAFTNGQATPLNARLAGSVGTDNFGEKRECLIEIQPVGKALPRKWNLVYDRKTAYPIGPVEFLWTSVDIKPGEEARLYFDNDATYYILEGEGLFLIGGKHKTDKRLETARTLTIQYDLDRSTTFDAEDIRLAQAIARKACPTPKKRNGP